MSSTVYVDLGPNNGGILLDLSPGGLSLQAVAKLIPEAELQLRFQLPGTERAIQTGGHVSWVGSTQKKAGICFENLPDNLAQQIAAWIDQQERQTSEAAIESEPETPTPAVRETVKPRLPSATRNLPSPAEGASRAVPTVSRYRPPVRPEVQAEPPTSAPVTLPATRSDSAAESSARFAAARELPSTESARYVRADVAASTSAAAAKTKNLADKLLLIRSGAHVRKVAIALAATLAAIVAIVIIVPNARREFESQRKAEPSAPSTAPSSVASSAAAPSQSSPAQANASGIGVPVSPSAQVAADSAPATDTQDSAPAPQGRGWIGRIRDLLGMSAPASISAAEALVPVWTVRHSGLYYCDGSSSYRTLKPGAMMAQGDALQEGYRPKYGGYCQ